ncbi:MAG: hypothetical protein U5R49_16155 [Deltaproteobacteria bacterium]|nr:hypothetical protein [Deltaproteobacteria bacterium]
MISEKAVAEDQAGMYVYVVGKDNKVERRSVKVGFVYNHQKIIWKGLKAGERVITEGLQMIRPGMTVQPKEAKPAKQGKAESPDSQATAEKQAIPTESGKSGTKEQPKTEKKTTAPPKAG